jgi:hypothetical protein
MKKYLLTILALGATMMMACNPDNNNGGGDNPEPPVKADYELTTISLGYIDSYGDYYGVGLNNYYLEIGVVEGTTGRMIAVEYMMPASCTDGLGTIKADPNWLESLMAGSAKPNHYFAGLITEEGLYGSAYGELNLATEEINLMEGIVDGDITISHKDGLYTVKGLVSLGSGKTLKIDATGELEFGDYSDQGGAMPLSVKGAKFGRTPRFFSSILKK